MDFRLLGPLEASERGRRLPLGGPTQRAVLAHLLIRANEVVSAERLIDEVWGDEPPETARSTLHSYVSRLRQVVRDGARIEGRAPGYVLHVDPARVDASCFEALARDGRRLLGEGNNQRALERLEEALGLWHGPPLADLAEDLSVRAERARLEEVRLGAIEDRVAAKLALGHEAELAAELESLVAEHPLRERLWAHLMLALYRSGRQAEALEAYQRARTLLADELGLDPSPELRELQGRILRQDAALEPEAERLRGYRLLEQIGSGSFGVVHRALQPHVGREVAVKVINPSLANDARFVRRFEAEAQLVARLEHPRIVPLYDYWRDPDGAYLVMRLLRGGNLKRELEAGPLEPERAVTLVGQVATGLAVAHRQGVVHRDVKPANILLDEDGNAYLSDFGIATDVASTLAPPSPDTIAYLSPEQLRGEAATPRTDVYSLGVVLREAVPEATISRPLGEVIERATAERPAARYADAEALAEALASLGETAAPLRVSIPTRNPYKGLRAFEEADADDFFGREALVDRLAGRLREGARFLALVGASGSGKSSAVRAGLFPALRAGAVPGSSDWFLAEMSPGAEPFDVLGDALRRISVGPSPGQAEERGSELLLFVDQLEELFTLVEDGDRRTAFLDQLAAVATDPDNGVRVIVALRADFYDRPLEHSALASLVRSGVETVVPPSAEEVERAIASPAARVGVECEPGLVGKVVADVAGRAALPLLQYALTELFERRHDGVMTLAAYDEIGGLAGAVARRAEEIYEGAGERGQEAARQLFLRLVALGEAGGDTRRRVSRSELASLEVDHAALDQVIDAFGRHRLLSFDRDPHTRAPTVEVAHEALLQTWDRLREWVEGARGDVRMRARLAAAASEWNASRRDSSFLLGGARLELFDAWAQSSSLALARLERDYLEASRNRRDAARAEEETRRLREAALEGRSRRRLQALVLVLALAALAAVGLTVFAFDQRQEARAEAARAEDQARIAAARELAAAAVANLEGDPELSILLALEAIEATGSADGSVLREAEEALHQSVQASRVVLTVPGLFGLAFAPDGRRLATTNADGTARIWDFRTGAELVRLTGHEARTLSVDFSTDGTLIATSSEDGTAKVWDAESGEELQTFSGHEAGLRSPHFSPDGSVLATTSFDGTTRLWNVETGKQLRVLRHTGGIEFSPDGTRLVVSDPPIAVHDVSSGRRLLVVDGITDPRDATWSNDGSRIGVSDGDGFAYVFDAETGVRLLTLVGHKARSVVGEIAFSRDDRRLVTSGSDGTVRVWDAAEGLELLALRGLEGNVEGSVFSPDGTLVAASGGSGIAKVWDVTPAGSREVLTIPGHRDVVYGIGFTLNGERLATGSVDGTAAVWDARTGDRVLTLRGTEGRVEDLAVSADGSRLATAAATAKVWDAATGRELHELAGHDGPVLSVAFSADGTRIATGGDGTGRVWDTASGDELAVLERHGGPIFGVAFSPDGSRVATASQDETAKVWDASTGAELATMSRHQDNVNAVVFSPDGRRLLTAGEDGRVKVWDASSGQELDVVTGHAAGLLDIAFSPDGRRFATAGRDGTVRLWDAASRRELLTVAGHESGVSAVAFSRDGTHLAAAGEDGFIRIFALRIEELVELARARVTRTLDDDECRRYLHRERCPG